jgi:FkbM family methyltransferase
MGVSSLLKRAAVDGVHSLFMMPPFEAALALFTRDREISDAVARLAPVNLRYDHPTYRDAIREGIRYKLDISDYQDWIVYWGIATNRPRRLYQLIQKDHVVFDVGSNLGEVCLRAAAQVGPGGMVHAFEPDPISFRKLTDNLALNPFGNVFVSNLGLGEAPATLEMRVPCDTNRGGNRIWSGSASAHFPVHIETLDRMVAERELERVDVIKIDVEGFELSVLKGARETLARFRPALFVELCDANLREQRTSGAEVIDHLHAAGYVVSDAGTDLPLDARAPLPPMTDLICRAR